MRTQFVACVGLSMVLGACAQREVPPPAPSTLTRASAKQPPSVFDVPPQEMRKALVEGYRLAPDARFLLAVGEVHHLITGKPKGSAQAEFRDGGWRIHYAGLEVGALPEFPDFADFMATLSEWGRMLQKENPSSLSAANSSSAAVKAQLDQFFVPHLMAALR